MSWQKVTIASVCEGIYDGPHATPAPSESGAIFLGIHNFVNGRLDLSNVKYISFDDLPKWTRRVTPQENDIVFSYEATLNLYAIIPPDFLGCLGRRMALIRVNPQKIYYKFLYYYFFSPEWRALIAEKTILGATVDRIPLTTFPQFLISLPPRATQHRIADILSAYDDLIENNQKQIQLLEEAAQRLYKEWFVDLRFPGHENTRIVDGVPEGWEKFPFSSKVSIMSGGTPKTTNKSFYEGEIPFYTPKDYPNNFFVFDTELHISNDGLLNCNSAYFPSGTIIITARGTVGKTVILGIPMAMNQSCYALKSDDLGTPYYLFFSINQEVSKLKVMSNGGVFNTIITKTFDNIHITIPNNNLHKNFDNNINFIMEKIKKLLQQNKLLQEMRNTLLPKLIK